MAKLLFFIIIFFGTSKSLNIETYLSFWCKEPLKMIDFQPRLTDEYYKKEAGYKCGIWLRHIPNKHWSKNLTALLYESLKPKLSVLKISDDLDSLDENFFDLGLRLRYLDLSGNQLNHFTVPDVKLRPYSINIFDYLQGFDLSHNNFTNISCIKINGPFMQDLDLSQNQFTEFPLKALQHFPLLNKLIIKKNNITKFENCSIKYPSLEYLDLSFNQLQSLHGLQSFVNLRILWLSHNNFPVVNSSFFSSEFWSLRELYLDHDNIEEICPNAFKTFPNIQKLNLGHNNISKLDPGVFQDLKRLESLDISDNFIMELDPNLFASQKKLCELNFRENLIINFDYISIISRSPSLKEIDLLKNLINCKDFDKMLLYLEEKAIHVTGEEQCALEGNDQKCCIKSEIESSTFSYYGAQGIAKTTEKIDPLQLMVNRTSHNISEHILSMERKSDDFFKLVVCQFGFFIVVSLMVFVIYVCRRSGKRKPPSVEKKEDEGEMTVT